jgi:2-dehydropantoate 2-reductase
MADPILIAGTGALACLFAARLAAVGAPVTMIGTWREGLAALRQHGVTLVRPDGSQTSYAVGVLDDAAECAGFSTALVLVKSWQTARAAEQLRDCLTAEGVALTLQNGLGNREALAAELGEERVALGVTTTGATLLSSGRVRPGGEGLVSVGRHERLAALLPLLEKAGFNLAVADDLDSLLWSKLAINAAINPLTALLETPNGALLERPAAHALLKGLADEVQAVAAARGIRLTFADAVTAAEGVARATAANHSSMYQDIQRGAPTEIDAICGAVVHAGERAGVPTPNNYALWKLVKAKVN